MVPVHPREAARLAALHDLDILDTEPEEQFTALCETARDLFQAPIALVSLVGETDQWFKARCGIDLTGTEFDLLLMLACEPGKVFSRDDILNQLRGHEVELYTRAVDIVVSRLRKKLEPLPAIKTLRNAGYALALRQQADRAAP